MGLWLDRVNISGDRSNFLLPFFGEIAIHEPALLGPGTIVLIIAKWKRNYVLFSEDRPKFKKVSVKTLQIKI